MPKWTITYHTITQESAEDGDYASHGRILPGGWHDDLTDARIVIDPDSEHLFDSLRAAMHYVHPSADAGTWFEEESPDTNYRTGEDEYRQLHPPKGITKSSYNRVKRVLGVR